MNLPHADVTTSNYTIAAHMMMESAKHQIALAHQAQERGKYQSASDLYASAVACYQSAGEQLMLHTRYLLEKVAHAL